MKMSTSNINEFLNSTLHGAGSPNHRETFTRLTTPDRVWHVSTPQSILEKMETRLDALSVLV
jgi:hypothetical protein